MEAIKINNAGVKMIAHRGLSGIECENTNAAFVAAGNRSYFGIETDTHVTADGKFAIIHDEVTGRVCDTDIPVEGSTLQQLQSLTLKNPRFDECRSDYKIPELKEYIGICRKYDKVCVLELKGRMTTEAIMGIVDAVNAEDYLDEVIFISFEWENLVDLKAVCPSCTAQFLTIEWEDEKLDDLKKYGISLDIYYGTATEKLVNDVHACGLEINCWTVDDAREAEKLVSWGVDYITTNILE